VALIRWIAQISDIGRVGHTIDRVEAATSKALTSLQEHPLFDCWPLDGEPAGAAISSVKLGYVQHFDAKLLQRLADEHDLRISVTARPGAYVSASRPLMWIEGQIGDDLVAELIDAFVVGDQRSFDNDPRFGLVVLGEIADKALSPSLNDPGTAIDVIGTVTRILCNLQPETRPESVKNDRVAVVPLDPKDLLEDAFRPIARDGAGLIEVALRLLHSLEIIARLKPHLRQAALDTARDAAGRAQHALGAENDLKALKEAAAFAVSGR
ncbi:MAG: DUF2254 domain-containing protein, partial [Pseudaminobacter sp.]|nr:DUF2254 domain-containing protein [Pseudaminobacter sp.]